jgi:hypothetical protein
VWEVDGTPVLGRAPRPQPIEDAPPGLRARASGASINGLGTRAPATVTMAKTQIPVQTALGASPYFEQVGAANRPRVH